jgi:hypothetical protein
VNHVLRTCVVPPDDSSGGQIRQVPQVLRMPQVGLMAGRPGRDRARPARATRSVVVPAGLVSSDAG